MNTIAPWKCKQCPWEGFIRTGHQWTFRVLPDGDKQGPFTAFLDLIAAMRKIPKRSRRHLEITTRAQCPDCGSWEMTKEDLPFGEEEG